MAELYVDPETNEERTICGFVTATGDQCMRRPNDQTGYCFQHSDTALIGSTSSDRRNRYELSIPRTLLDLTKGFAEEDFYGLRDEIEVLDLRTRDLLERLPEDTLLSYLEEIVEKMRLLDSMLELAESSSGSTRSAIEQTFEELRTLVESAADDRRTWRDILDVIEQRRKLVESERKRAVEAQQIITQRQAAVLLQNILDIINRHVTNRTAKASIAADLSKLASTGAVNHKLL